MLQDLPTLFAAVDTDGNGDIDPMEFAAFIDGCVSTFPGGHDPIPQEEINAAFSYIDTNNNGMLDFDEFEYFFYVRKPSKSEGEGKGGETKQPANVAAGPTSDDVAAAAASSSSSSTTAKAAPAAAAAASSSSTGSFEPLPSTYEEWSEPRGAPKDHFFYQLDEKGYYKCTPAKTTGDATAGPMLAAPVVEKTKLYCVVNIYQIRSIDAQSSSFTCKLRLYLFWNLDWSAVANGDAFAQRARDKGNCYALSEREVGEFVEGFGDLPSVTLFNAIETECIDSQPGIRAYGMHGGACMWNLAWVACFKESFELRNFPFDAQTLNIDLRQASGATWDNYDLVVCGVQFHRDAIEQPEWTVLTPKIERCSHMQTKIELRVKRMAQYYVTNVIGILAMLTLLVLTVFAVPVDDLADRMGIVLTLLLTAVAFKFVVADTVPKVGYSTQLDRYMLLNMAFLFFSALVCTAVFLVKYYNEADEEEGGSGDVYEDEVAGMSLNQFSMIASGGVFAVINLLWFFGVIFAKKEVKDGSPVKLVDKQVWYYFAFANPPFLPS